MLKTRHTPWIVRLFVAVMFGLAGCITMSVIIGWAPEDPVGEEATEFFVCAGLGAAMGGVLFAPFVGRERPRAWLPGGFGAVFGTLVGAGLGGLALGIFESWPIGLENAYSAFLMALQLGVAAMMIVFVSMFMTLAGPLWLGLMIATQIGARYLRRLYPEPFEVTAFD